MHSHQPAVILPPLVHGKIATKLVASAKKIGAPWTSVSVLGMVVTVGCCEWCTYSRSAVLSEP